MTYKVSILIPCWNIRDYVERVISSVYCQTYDNIECICVDDGSTDGTYKRLEEIVNELPNRRHIFRIYRREENKGLVYTRRQLLDLAKGDFIFWLDGDDWIEANTIELLVSVQGVNDADIVSGLICINNNKKDLFYNPSNRYGLEEYRKSIFLTRFNHNAANKLIRASIIPSDICMTYGLEVGEDWLFMSRVVLNANSFVQVREVTYHYFMHNNNSIAASKPKSDQEMLSRAFQKYNNLLYIKKYVEHSVLYSNWVDMQIIGVLYYDILFFSLKNNSMVKDVVSQYLPHFRNYTFRQKKKCLGLLISLLLYSRYTVILIPILYSIKHFMNSVAKYIRIVGNK